MPPVVSRCRCQLNTKQTHSTHKTEGPGGKRFPGFFFGLMDYGPSLIGLLVGLVVGATSTGGGALLTPALVLIARVPVATAIGSDVLIASGMKLFGGGIYALRGEVHWQTVGRLASGSVAGAVAGIWLLNRIPAAAIDAWLAPALGIVLIAAGGAIILRLTAGPDSRPRHAPRRHVTVLVGLATGLLVSMTSIGSGSIPAVRARALLPAERHHDRRARTWCTPWWSRRSPRWATPSRDASTWRWPRRCLSGPCRA